MDMSFKDSLVALGLDVEEATGSPQSPSSGRVGIGRNQTLQPLRRGHTQWVSGTTWSLLGTVRRVPLMLPAGALGYHIAV